MTDSTVARFPTKRKAAYPTGKIDWGGNGAPEGIAVLRPRRRTRYMPERSTAMLVLVAIIKSMPGEQQLAVARALYPLFDDEDPNAQAAWNFLQAIANGRDF